jgi:uncharacterized damage-inducible protein DinB
MTEPQRIADLLQRAIHGKAWHGHAVLELLADVTPAQAAKVPAGGNSIWALLMHSTTWIRAAHRRAHGQAYKPKPEENFAPVPEATAENWRRAKADLETATADLVGFLQTMPEEDLHKPSVAYPKVTVYIELHGAIQHALYHAGQIALVKK